VKGILALEHPTIALSVKTRQAIRIVLNAQHDTVKQLRMEGALQETDANLLKKVSECTGFAYVIACGVYIYALQETDANLLTKSVTAQDLLTSSLVVFMYTLQETDANLCGVYVKKASEFIGIAYIIACGVYVYFIYRYHT
jgi:hypothetical protein